jgi:hypothetical protein
MDDGGVMHEKAAETQHPLKTHIVEGAPIQIGKRELVPLVRVTTYAQRQARVGADNVAGQGWGFVQMHPVAILERSVEGERCLPIWDKTAQAMGGLLLAAFIIPLLLMLAARLVRR